MENLESKVLKYRENIGTLEITDALKVYYETKDAKIRENIFLRYMNTAKRIVLSFNLPEEKEDLEQIAYEILLNCIDNFNPYNKSAFSNYLNSALQALKEKYDRKKSFDNINITGLDIISNTDLEAIITDELHKEELIKRISELLTNSNCTKGAKVFGKIYGIEELKQIEISDKRKISRQAVNESHKIILINLYLNLFYKYKYYPSKIINNFLSDKSIRKCDKYKQLLGDTNLDKLEELSFHKPYDTISDSHRLVKYKR